MKIKVKMKEYYFYPERMKRLCSSGELLGWAFYEF